MTRLRPFFPARRHGTMEKTPKEMIALRRLLCALCTLLLLTSSALADQTLVLTFAGDVTLGSEENIRDHEGSFDSFAQREGHDYFFALVQDLFARDDLTIVNLEGVLADSTRGRRSGKNVCFRGPTSMTAILTSGSIDAVNLANNHTYDYGKTGYASTQTALDEAGIAHFGQRSVYIYDCDGMKVAFFGLAAADFYDHDGWLSTEIPRLKAEEGVDAVIFTFHAGYEYRKRHSPRQEEYAQAALDAGADLVIMHHPHVVQGVEIDGDSAVFYSLGNFCFGGNKTVRSIGALVVQATLHFSDAGEYLGQQLRLYPAHISGTEPVTNYQPRLVNGKDALAVMKAVQHDTKFTLPAFDEALGCVELPFLAAE